MRVQEALRVPVAVVGCGAAGAKHVAYLAESEAAEVRWVCDQDRKAVESCGACHGVARRSTDYHEVLADEDLRAVVVATPPSSHCEVALAAICAGKNVLVEKPLAISLVDARVILEASRGRPDLVVMDCSARHSRLHEKYHYIRREIASGAVGEVYCVHHRAVQRNARPGVEYHPEARWFTLRALSGGGPLLDFGGYDLAFHFGVLGLRPPCVKQMIAITRNGLDEISLDRGIFDVEEHGVVMMELQGGVAYYWERATNAYGDAGDITRIYGTRGGLRFSYPSWLSGVIERFEPGGREYSVVDLGSLGEPSAQEDYRRLDLHFLACVLGTEQPILPLDEAVENLAIIMAAYNRQDADKRLGTDSGGLNGDRRS